MAHIAQRLDDVPLLDVEPSGAYELRRVVCAPTSGQVGRRGFLRVIAAGGMALGLTVLGWLRRRAGHSLWSAPSTSTAPASPMTV